MTGDLTLKKLFRWVPKKDVPALEKEGLAAGTVLRRTPPKERWPDGHVALVVHVRDGQVPCVLTAGRGDGEVWTVLEAVHPDCLSFYTNLEAEKEAWKRGVREDNG